MGRRAGWAAAWRGLPRRDRALEGLALVIAGLAAAGLRPSTPWPAYLDGGWYAAAAARIAATGALWQTVDAAADPVFVATLDDHRRAGLSFPSDAQRGFHAVAFTVPEVGRGRVAPYHPPLAAGALAPWARRLGPDRVAEGIRPWALAWLVGVGALAAAVGGAAAAPLAVALAAAGAAWRLYGAQPYAEMVAGALVLAGLVALTRLASAARARPAEAAWAGLALGMAALAKIDAAPVAPAAALWWLLTRRRRGGRREGAALAAALAAPAAYGLALALGPTAVYARLNGWGLVALARAAGPQLAAVALLAAAALLGRRWLARLPAAAPALALALAAGLATARDVTPGIELPSMVAVLGLLVTPLGVWAAIAGVAAPTPPERRPAAGVLWAALVVAVAVMVAPVVTRTLSPLYVARRLVPLALPLTAVLAARATLDAAGRVGTAGRALLAGGVALALFGSAAAAAPFRSGREFAGAEALVARLAVYGTPADRWLMPSALGDDDTGRLAAAMWALEDRAVAVIGPPDAPAGRDGRAAAAAVRRWRGQGRNVFWLSAGPAPQWPGVSAARLGREAVVTWALRPTPELPPRYERLELDVTVWALDVAPEAAPPDVAPAPAREGPPSDAAPEAGPDDAPAGDAPGAGG